MSQQSDEMDQLRREKEALEAKIRALELAAQNQQNQSSAAASIPDAHHTASAEPQPSFSDRVVAALASRGMMNEQELQHQNSQYSHERNPPMASGLHSQLMSIVDESSLGANNMLFKHLKTIINNILDHPNEKRYRRLRYDNPKLQREFFTHNGSVQFLEMIGFTWTSTDPSAEKFLCFEPAKPLQPLMVAINAIDALIARDQALSQQSQAEQSRRHTLGLEIRMEKLRESAKEYEGNPAGFYSRYEELLISEEDRAAADRAGGASAVYATSLLLKNDDVRSLRAIQLLCTLAQNVLKDPAEKKYRWIKFANPTLARELFPIDGALEFLLAAMGFEWVEAEAVEGAGLELKCDVCVDQDAAFLNDSNGEIELQIRRLSAAITLLNNAERAVNQRRKVTLAEQREEMRRLMRQEERSVRKELGAPIRKNERSNSDNAAARPTGRIPIAEALDMLMGRKKECEKRSA